ncbi:Uncharacterised protein [Pseudomonas fluorescens]|uniref:Uncharacterized protein n=1 Tax=Pseudomonas fluorescens TaxID=294 RepID=A0A379IG59_PSEFL|nr:hypothetical protein [Pseudomonas fluorescens]AIG01933.1 hypothetical protein HZ99_07050 [Pseudomonas fluorescens]SUD31731.1 Uncharacterised protein [Pseudomonas fluorescens]
MLNAIISSKKRGSGLENRSQALAEGSEDVLTASVFERLAYLPDPLLSAVMTQLIGQPFGPLQQIEFWPSWPLANRTRVEPDVLLCDAQLQIVIEAKRHDHRRQQDPEQLANELLAGWQGDLLQDNCILLALGGLDDASDDANRRLLGKILDHLPEHSEPRFKLVCRTWQQLYQSLEHHIRPDSPPGCQRLLDDIAKCYAWHGLRTHPMRWLSDLPALTIATPPNAFAAWSKK